jgi:hypothetical protein
LAKNGNRLSRKRGAGRSDPPARTTLAALMLAIFIEAAATIAQELGEAATYAVDESGETISLRAIVRRDVQTPIGGMESAVQARRTVIQIERAKLAGHKPVRDDTVTVGAETWRVLAIENDDGYMVRLKVVETT